MYISKKDEYSDAQALLASAASTYYIDHQKEGRALNAPWLRVAIPTALDSTGEAATLTIALRTSASISGGALVGPTTLWTSAAIAEASLVAGYVAALLRLPEGLLRYSDLYFTAGTENFTSGNIDADLVLDPELGY